MKKELELFLVDRYPQMFRDYGGSPQKTCMAWGMTHGCGWFGILCDLCEKIDKELEARPELREGFKFAQIKEKFGTLRVYIDGGDRAIWDLVNQAEKESVIVCEECGTKDNVSCNCRGWIRTLCESCRKDSKNSTE